MSLPTYPNRQAAYGLEPYDNQVYGNHRGVLLDLTTPSCLNLSCLCL